MRGRLIFVFSAEFVRLDARAMAEGAPDVDPDFREPRVIASEPDGVGTRVRHELPPVRVPCQVEPESFEALHMVGAGNEPESKVRIVVHFRDLEALGLVDPATGRARLQPGDRMTGFYDRTGALVQLTDLHVTEARPIGFGFGLLRPRRNLLLLVLERRAATERGVATGQ
jgi:hypothetical protein